MWCGLRDLHPQEKDKHILEKMRHGFYITLEKIKHGANTMIKCLGKYKIRKINIIIER